MEKRVRTKRLIAITMALCWIMLFAFVGLNKAEANAFADGRDKEMRISQSEELYYCGEDYLASNRRKNQIYSVFSFRLDGEEISVNPQNINIYCRKNLFVPNTYSVDFVVNYEGESYEVDDVKLKISKKIVTVTALLNGQEELVINEGDAISVNYDYDGGAPNDTVTETVNGVQVRTLSDSVLANKAYVVNLPKNTVTKYTVVATSARSDYYDFVYRKTLLTILPVTVPELTVKSNDTILVSVSGNYGNTSSLVFEDIGVSASSAVHASAWEKIRNIYSGKNILTDYDKIASYRLNVYVSGELPYSATPGIVKINMAKNLQNKNEYKVIALYNNGDSDILDALMSADGELVFGAADMGYFVVVSPTEGVTTYMYIVAIVCGVVFVLLVVFFVALFRRKY